MAKPAPGAFAGPPLSSLPMPKKYLPNWALAGALGGFVVGTYMYTMQRVAGGSDDLSHALDQEADRIAGQAESK